MKEKVTREINWWEATTNVLKRRFWLILLAAVVGGAGITVYKAVTYKPAYTSVATVYVLNSTWIGEGEDSSLEKFYNTMLASVNAVDDCKAILERSVVLDKVSEAVGVRVTNSMVNISLVGEESSKSRMIDIKVTARDAQLAHDITEAICTYGQEAVKSIMKVDLINLVDSATMPQKPNSSRFSLSWVLVGACGGAALLFCIFLAVHVMSEKICTPEDVEQYLDMRVLGVIPGRESEKEKGLRYGRFPHLMGKYGNKYYRRENGSYGQ